MKVFYADQLRAVQKGLEDREGPIPEPSFFEVMSWRLGVMARTLVDQVTKRPSRARLQSLSDKGS